MNRFIFKYKETKNNNLDFKNALGATLFSKKKNRGEGAFVY